MDDETFESEYEKMLDEIGNNLPKIIVEKGIEIMDEVKEDDEGDEKAKNK